MPINRHDPQLDLIILRWRRLPPRAQWRIFLLVARDVLRHKATELLQAHQAAQGGRK